MADYSEAWDKYRQRRNRSIVVTVSILPVWLLMLGVSNVVRDEKIADIALGVLVPCCFFLERLSRPAKLNTVRVRGAGNNSVPNGGITRVWFSLDDALTVDCQNSPGMGASKVDLVGWPD